MHALETSNCQPCQLLRCETLCIGLDKVSIAMRWPPLQNHLSVPALSLGGSLVPVVIADFSAAFLFMRASCGSGDASPALLSPRLLAPTLTGLPFAAEQMEVSNLL